MKVFFRIQVTVFLFVLVVSGPSWGQKNVGEGLNRGWDFGAWIAGSTGEENTNSFAEAQIISGGVFVGKAITGEIGAGWHRGSFEYGFTVIPVFLHLRPERIWGGGFEPVILRWKSNLRTERVAPYIELGGGAVRTNTNFPSGDTSNFNFTVRGGGGIQIFAAERHAVDIGCHWRHISNANLGVKNPEFNGIRVSLGYHWFK